jgi:F-type H+-transporting ATPase subunit gamma
MAGVSTKEIKTRIRSMESTRQITRAMEMVASAKLRKAQTKALACRPYYETLYAAMWDIVGGESEVS